ncbi:MAG: helix-turn-helix transcriptional regulator, partial [Clostridia bacterium]|nr:helix-turn-helix transcriptional regulator [Clostridia bacterium]
MFGERLKALRLTKGISQEELGKRLGVTKQTVSNWE